MSTKTTTAQPPGRRTPLSLNAGPKQNNKPSNDSGKRETNFNNMKTDNPKKDSQPEKKLTADKKQPSTETRKPASSDTKKTEEVKTTKLDENKKNQNGVSTNGTNSSTNGTNGTNTAKEKDTQNGNEGAAVKPKQGGASSGSETPKKESQKSNEKKKETASDVASKEAQKQDNKNKVDEKNKEKQKPNEEDNTKLDEKKEDEKTDTKGAGENIKANEKTGGAADIAKEGEQSNKAVEIINLDSSSEEKAIIVKTLPVKEHKTEEITALKTPIKENERQSKKEQNQKLVPGAQIDDVEMMEPLTFESEPPSSKISAASTPTKNLTFTRVDATPKSEVKLPRVPPTYTPDRKSCPRTFSSISGRRSIRPIGDYTLSGHLSIRESYRKINTELDYTTSSMNVTVGSEVPNNDSFSFFSHSRKRDRSSPSRPSNVEVQGDISPKSPKRARIEFGMTGFFNAMASPITMLRARLSRANVQSTPKNIDVELPIEEDVVENVSGISIEEDITPTEKLMVDPDSTVGNIVIDDNDNPESGDHAEYSDKPAIDELKYEDEIKVKETIRTTESQAKKKCSIM